MTTPPRQVWLFQLGCWLAFATACVQLLAHVFVRPPDVLASAAGPPGYLFLVPGQDVPSSLGVANGLSLSVALLLATLGTAGLVVVRRGYEDPRLFRGVARSYALGGAVLLGVSLINFFSLQSFFLATMALCFALAGVTET